MEDRKPLPRRPLVPTRCSTGCHRRRPSAQEPPTTRSSAQKVAARWLCIGVRSFATLSDYGQRPIRAGKLPGAADDAGLLIGIGRERSRTRTRGAGNQAQTPTRERNHNGYGLRWDDEAILFDPGRRRSTPDASGRCVVSIDHGDLHHPRSRRPLSRPARNPRPLCARPTGPVDPCAAATVSSCDWRWPTSVARSPAMSASATAVTVSVPA